MSGASEASANTPIEEQVKAVMIDFRMRRMKNMVNNPDSITDESKLPEELSRHAEAAAIVKVVRADALTAPSAGTGEGQFIENVSLDIAELPDRTSPEDMPEMMLVSHEELESIIKAHLPILLAPSPSRREPTREEEIWIRHVAEMVRSGAVPSMGRWSAWQNQAVAAAVLALLDRRGQESA